MVALRKDVKVGFVVGAAALAVVGVYTGLSALAGKPAAPAGDANKPDANKLIETARTDSARPDASTPAVAPAGQNVAQTPAAAANPTTPVAAPAGTSDDVWGNAFNSGSVPAVTVTPSLPNPSREAAAKPADILKALNDPSAPRPTPQQSASTNDPSGSLVDGGATPTLTRTPSTTRPVDAAGATTHVVKPGESFSSIAKQHYGDANLFKVLVAANPNVDPGKMKPGMTLTIPAREKAAAKPAAAATATPASVDATRQYVIKPGDSLEGIAIALYGDRAAWQSIYDANKSTIGDSPARLKVGTVLTLPTPPTKK